MKRKRGKLARFSREELREIAENIGVLLLQLPAKAAQLHHRRPINTYRDYMRVVEEDSKTMRAAKEYLFDFFGRGFGGTTDDLLRIWFTGDDRSPFATAPKFLLVDRQEFEAPPIDFEI